MTRHAGTELGPDRTADLVLAVTEVATNSVRYGGGHGALRIWRDDNSLICEVRDRGHLEYPLVGRRRPAVEPLFRQDAMLRADRLDDRPPDSCAGPR